MKNRTFWKAFCATFALCIVALFVVTIPTRPDCSSNQDNTGSCNRTERVKSALPVTLLIAVPMSIFVGIIATSMKPVEPGETKKTKGKK